MTAVDSILKLYRILSLKRKVQGLICLTFMISSAISESIVIFSLSNFLSILSSGFNVNNNNVKQNILLYVKSKLSKKKNIIY